MDPEKIELSQVETVADTANGLESKRSVALDNHGLPLVPQPTAYKDDPLNWHPALKLAVTLQASWLALLGPMGAAAPNPAFVLMSEAFSMSVVEISYELTIFLVFAGIGPLLTSPFANGYGRRPIYLVGNLVAAVTNVAAGYCDSWAGIMVTRAFNGLGAGATIAMGAATICDLYFVHQRGVYMGIYTLFLTNGAHLAPLLGGFVANSLGWRACFFIPGYIQLGTFVVTLFCLPETLYSSAEDGAETTTPHRDQTYWENLLFKRSRVPGQPPRLQDFIRPFKMLKCVAILFPATLYMTCFGYGSVLFALTGAKLFTHLYGFTTPQTGLMLSIPLLIGCLIGEASAGWVTDWMSNRHARKNNGERLPEARLNAIWGTLLIPIGLIVEGVCLSHANTVGWIGAAFGMGIANLGLQIATTVIYAYTTDCYKPQSAEISTILNVFRQIFSCLISFYALPFGERVGIQYAWLTFALIIVVLLLPVLMLRISGRRWRSHPSQVPVAPRS
ncbi:hypothetical protein FE257_007754 [Aspergillus nanangensis]|uniref:Major facilitator superfamily (MFS) profile domain-containing protein n=1 Tax=Aspergillus nanangensis TaxID=2582783 RepID=A0AAD4GYQ4_ASPNN|nr:hypothetical protein FE257_007754 [Aspergillus nanangensis]